MEPGFGQKNQKDFDQLQGLMKKHPELISRYDAEISQNFLISRQPAMAKPYLESALKRTSQLYYSNYSQTSLAIGEGDYRSALASSLKLKTEMLQDQSFWNDNQGYGSALFAFNLVRIANLQQQLGDHEGELSAWRELKMYGGWGEEIGSGVGKEGFKQLLSHFTVQETSLLDYIIAREEVLATK